MKPLDPEQLEAVEVAFKKSLESGIASITIEEYIAELTKPKPVFKAGEVVYGTATEKYFAASGLCDNASCRHLTPEEVPALALAIERLEYLAKINLPGCSGYAQTALDDIKAMI